MRTLEVSKLYDFIFERNDFDAARPGILVSFLEFLSFLRSTNDFEWSFWKFFFDCNCLLKKFDQLNSKLKAEEANQIPK